VDTALPRKRLTREERRAATRTDLLDAASRVFARQGFHAATLGDVAREAGYTTGAIYSNFAGKDELFQAAFEHQIARDVREVSEAQAGATQATPGARTRAASRRWMELVRERPEMFLLLLEYWAYAMRNPGVRESFLERFGAFRDTTARWLEEEAELGGWELPLPARDIAIGLNALMYGMAIQYLPGDEDLPDDGLEQMALAMMTGIREWTVEGRNPRRGRRARRD
jgi:AcrR family transcriptional regulator